MRRLLLAGSLSLLLSGCDRLLGPVPVRSLELSPDSAWIELGDTLRFAAVLRNERGTPLHDRLVRWATENAATVPVDTAGLATGLAPGITHIVASSGTGRDTAFVGVLVPFRTVAAGGDLTCGIAESARSYCWGAVGAKPVASPQQIALAAGARQITVGDRHTCALDDSGAARCWGENGSGQLGSSGSSSFMPVAVAGGNRFTVLSAGWRHTCGLDRSGAVYCWGDDRFGQLGTDSLVDGCDERDGSVFGCSPVPVQVSVGMRFQTVSAGMAATCAVATNGGVYCWGLPFVVEAGEDTVAPAHSLPARVAAPVMMRTVSVGADHACGLTVSGAAYCWGANTHGQLGTGDTSSTDTPTEIAGHLTFLSVQAGAGFACGLTPDGHVYCWGRNDAGQGGVAGGTDSLVPRAVQTDLRFESLGVGAEHVCAVASDGYAYCWGDNRAMQVGRSGVGTASPGRVVG